MGAGNCIFVSDVKHEGWVTFSCVNKLQKASGTPTTPYNTWEGRHRRGRKQQARGEEQEGRADDIITQSSCCSYAYTNPETLQLGKNSESIPRALNTNMQIDQKRDLHILSMLSLPVSIALTTLTLHQHHTLLVLYPSPATGPSLLIIPAFQTEPMLLQLPASYFFTLHSQHWPLSRHLKAQTPTSCITHSTTTDSCGPGTALLPHVTWESPCWTLGVPAPTFLTGLSCLVDIVTKSHFLHHPWSPHSWDPFLHLHPSPRLWDTLAKVFWTLALSPGQIKCPYSTHSTPFPNAWADSAGLCVYFFVLWTGEWLKASRPFTSEFQLFYRPLGPLWALQAGKIPTHLKQNNLIF